ncbi:5-methyltetrahydrofolate--homocysteine S-methyltransferase and 5,10-methylenetetrahydrofolate reductase [Syntrophotalea carbinolica DSM 2380]|uniref:5-methyltetrahydrofolate--homocysteine S-methyltransferase and 5,10-methylenetetrahydrofolate reductase n=1 Tax=Syntrophotalea carbinolica (strain DSM 2380 / NBRC 103641 / GraBd1) TaxID=338963 RepID=Q3A7Z3_SYNC1|nr:bifunctional homocysteine S-methyltransferase/methylenetetrahydrofolate reductase [Syntrophotalea carbinolica]ABA87499.1 5-methyltetrahydrofolate--homocysteine S-methyltransferase and 5,10-methylenetetrahydrofolate reductase [Syntrophotalea carbinolica DSM 2380]
MKRAEKSLMERLEQGVIVGDGAMGTLLYHRGVPLSTCFELLNLQHPETVRQIHRDYLAAGAQLLETNTFAANRLRLAAIGQEDQVRSINSLGAQLARQAAGSEALVAGAIGPLGRTPGETADLAGDERRELFREQMEGLAEGGADLLLLETFASLEELELAVTVASRIGLPIVAQMAFFEGGRTREGVTADEAARRLVAAGASLVGANCGSGPRDVLAVLRTMAAETDCPLSGFANSGFPEYVDGRYIYLATPEYFAARGREMVEAGARLIGGCCGTTPEHIRALAAAVADLKPAARCVVPALPKAATVATEPGPEHRGFLSAWGKRPIITVELDPPRGLDCDKILAGARRLADAGADAISLAENPLARIRMGNIALAKQIQDQIGIETIIHVTGRDRNLIGLHSEMMGAHLLGLRNVLAVTGDPVAVGGEAGASNVFDLNSIGVLQLLSALNNGHTLVGGELGEATRFQAGAAFNPNVSDMSGQLRRLKKKVAAGARFVQTQPIYSVDVLDAMLACLADIRIPILVGILPLVSERNAEFLHNEVPGILLPETVRARMRGTRGEEGKRQGLAIARELIEAGRGRVDGFYLMPPFGKVDIAVALIEVIRG